MIMHNGKICDLYRLPSIVRTEKFRGLWGEIKGLNVEFL
jgi:hypothetical protein